MYCKVFSVLAVLLRILVVADAPVLVELPAQAVMLLLVKDQRRMSSSHLLVHF